MLNPSINNFWTPFKFFKKNKIGILVSQFNKITFLFYFKNYVMTYIQSNYISTTNLNQFKLQTYTKHKIPFDSK